MLSILTHLRYSIRHSETNKKNSYILNVTSISDPKTVQEVIVMNQDQSIEPKEHFWGGPVRKFSMC